MPREDEKRRERSRSKGKGSRKSSHSKRSRSSSRGAIHKTMSASRTRASVHKLISGAPMNAVLGTAFGSGVAAKMLQGREYKTGQWTAVGEDSNPCKKELDDFVSLASNQLTEATTCVKAIEHLKKCVLTNPAYFGK
ncbi:uncharacterized protein LOC101850634 [Aplysia californica]|uniref:Uncharacterized protein LOC101850634 n=1 Tax=Aplysia californica TaxID=6500 RepID=A0ABM0JGJ6_APLCA|nr:uncharacterized protein LOC101850634 [Aplysia californica]